MFSWLIPVLPMARLVGLPSPSTLATSDLPGHLKLSPEVKITRLLFSKVLSCVISIFSDVFILKFSFDVAGPPFKWKMTKTEHQRFVQSVRYSPNGDHFATGGFDGKIFVYDGKTSDLIGELGKKSQNLFHHRNLNIISKYLKFNR